MIDNHAHVIILLIILLIDLSQIDIAFMATIASFCNSHTQNLMRASFINHGAPCTLNLTFVLPLVTRISLPEREDITFSGECTGILLEVLLQTGQRCGVYIGRIKFGDFQFSSRPPNHQIKNLAKFSHYMVCNYTQMASLHCMQITYM